GLEVARVIFRPFGAGDHDESFGPAMGGVGRPAPIARLYFLELSSVLVYRTLIASRRRPISRTTSTNEVGVSGPRPVASPERPPFLDGASSSGGLLPWGQAAEKFAVIVPTEVELGKASATALLAYSVTRNASAFALVRCQPGTVRVCFLGTIQRE